MVPGGYDQIAALRAVPPCTIWRIGPTALTMAGPPDWS